MSRFIYNGPESRCTLGERELHCGDCFEIRDEAGQWHHTRIEHTLSLDCRWYLIGVPHPRAMAWDGCEAREYP